MGVTLTLVANIKIKEKPLLKRHQRRGAQGRGYKWPVHFAFSSRVGWGWGAVGESGYTMGIWPCWQAKIFNLQYLGRTPRSRDRTFDMSHIMRKPVYAICRQQRHSLISTFVVRCLDSTASLVSISEISSLYLASVAVQAGLCLTWSQTLKTGFLVTRLKSKSAWK